MGDSDSAEGGVEEEDAGRADPSHERADERYPLIPASFFDLGGHRSKSKANLPV